MIAACGAGDDAAHIAVNIAAGVDGLRPRAGGLGMSQPRTAGVSLISSLRAPSTHFSS
jgi:hypothetical protein